MVLKSPSSLEKNANCSFILHYIFVIVFGLLFLFIHNFIDTYYFLKLCFSEAKNLDDYRSFKFTELNFLLIDDMRRCIEIIRGIRKKYQPVDKSFDELIEMEKDAQLGVIKLKKADLINMLYEKNKQGLNLVD